MRVALVILLTGLYGSGGGGVQAQIGAGIQRKVDEFFEVPGHASNWAVLVSTSRFWFNYRHAANVLSLYHSIKRLGIPDSNIIMMIADPVSCDSRNALPGTVLGSASNERDLYGSDVEIDFRGPEVTVEAFIRLLTGRASPDTPRSRRLLSDHQSNVLIYLTGHGGDGFLKFQDTEELTSVDLAWAVRAMHESNRYHEVMLILDTCRSASLYEWIDTPNVLSTSSSLTHEESYSYEVHSGLGVYVIDRYSHFTLSFMEREVTSLESNRSLQHYLDACPHSLCMSTIGVRSDQYGKDPARVRLTDFFGSRRLLRPLAEELVDFDTAWIG